MTGITTYLSVLTLNVKGLHFPIKRHHLMNWIKKEDPTILAYRRSISSIEISIGLGRKAGRRFTKPVAPKTGRSSNTYLKKSRIQTYIDQMR
jgi:hypothetical protein